MSNTDQSEQPLSPEIKNPLADLSIELDSNAVDAGAFDGDLPSLAAEGIEGMEDQLKEGLERFVSGEDD